MKNGRLWNRIARSFSSKLFLCIFSTSFALLLVGELILFGTADRASSAINSALTEENLRITAQNIEQILSRLDDSIRLAFSQNGMMEATQKDWFDDLEAYTTLRTALNVTVASDEAICQMAIISDEDGILKTSSSRIIPYHDRSSCMAYLGQSAAVTETSGSMWYFLQPHPMDPQGTALVNVRQVEPLIRNPKDMLLAVTVPEEALSRAYGFLGKDAYIAEEGGTIISAVDRERIGEKVEPELLTAAHQAGRSGGLLRRQGSEFYYSVELPSISSYLLVKAEAGVLASTRQMMVVIVVTVVVLGLLFSLLWSQFTAKTLTKPLNRLKMVMEKARGGNLQVRCQAEQTDELGYLCDSFNQMMDDLNAHLRDLKEQQDLAKENEIRLLQSQINPHLLYNTLDSALCLMSQNETGRSVRILEELSQYFKLALQRGNKMITLAAAIDHVQTYLNLQRLCRMKEFELVVCSQVELDQVRIPHMLLQPIVENAVLHGFDGSFSDGTIEIEVERREDRLVLRITDDGMGMDEEELEDLRQCLEKSAPSGRSFGLWNIARQIQMACGPQYGLKVESELGEYTTVILEIPAVYQDEPEEGTHV